MRHALAPTPNFATKRPAEAPPVLTVTRPGDAMERGTDDPGRVSAVERDADRATPGVVQALAAAGPGRPLPAAGSAYFAPRFGDLSDVRIHDDTHAAALARAIDARAFARGNDVFFGSGQYAPGRPEGLALISHELAHTRQPGAKRRIARKTLSELSEPIRKRIMIARTVPVPADVAGWIKSYFNPRSGTSRSAGITIEWGAEITDAQQKKGLEAIFSELASLSQVLVIPATATEPEQRTQTDPESYPLPVDGLTELELDLRPQRGEDAIFRFVRYKDGTTEKGLIERTKILAPAPAPATAPTTGGQAPAPGGQRPAQTPAQTPGQAPTQTPAQTPAQAPGGTQAQAPTFTGLVAVGNVKVTIGSGFSNDQGKLIADAVGLLPEPIRAKVDGVSFEFAGTGQGPGGQNGQYQEDKDTVQIWGNLFNPSVRRVGEATNTAYQIVHELGHVVDRRPFFKSQIARDKEKKKKADLELELRRVPGKFIDPNDPLPREGDDPRIAAEERRIKGEIAAAQREIDRLNTAMANDKSIAGDELGGNTESMLTDFARALTTDGVTAVTDARQRNKQVDAANKAAEQQNAANPNRPPIAMRPHEPTLKGGLTRYAQTNLMEAFAENFAAYVLDPNVFAQLRPATAAYFTRNFPKTVPTSPARTP